MSRALQVTVAVKLSVVTTIQIELGDRPTAEDVARIAAEHVAARVSAFPEGTGELLDSFEIIEVADTDGRTIISPWSSMP